MIENINTYLHSPEYSYPPIIFDPFFTVASLFGIPELVIACMLTIFITILCYQARMSAKPCFIVFCITSLIHLFAYSNFSSVQITSYSRLLMLMKILQYSSMLLLLLFNQEKTLSYRNIVHKEEKIHFDVYLAFLGMILISDILLQSALLNIIFLIAKIILLLLLIYKVSNLKYKNIIIIFSILLITIQGFSDFLFYFPGYDESGKMTLIGYIQRIHSFNIKHIFFMIVNFIILGYFIKRSAFQGKAFIFFILIPFAIKGTDYMINDWGSYMSHVISLYPRKLNFWESYYVVFLAIFLLQNNVYKKEWISIFSEKGCYNSGIFYSIVIFSFYTLVNLYLSTPFKFSYAPSPLYFAIGIIATLALKKHIKQLYRL